MIKLVQAISLKLVRILCFTHFPISIVLFGYVLNPNCVNLYQTSVFAKLPGMSKMRFSNKIAFLRLSFYVAEREQKLKKLNGKGPKTP